MQVSKACTKLLLCVNSKDIKILSVDSPPTDLRGYVGDNRRDFEGGISDCLPFFILETMQDGENNGYKVKVNIPSSKKNQERTSAEQDEIYGEDKQEDIAYVDSCIQQKLHKKEQAKS